MRRGKDSEYSDKLDEFIISNALLKSMEAYQDTVEGSDRYQYMVKGLMAAMEEHWPGSTEYLMHACSEGSMSWTEERDLFAIPTVMDRHPIFPDRPILSRRKSRQADLSKQYMVRVACELLKKRNIEVETTDKALGYDKSGKLQTDEEFKIAKTDKDNVFSMLLHSLQLHTGAASVIRRKDQVSSMLGEHTYCISLCLGTRLSVSYQFKKGDSFRRRGKPTIPFQ